MVKALGEAACHVLGEAQRAGDLSQEDGARLTLWLITETIGTNVYCPFPKQPTKHHTNYPTEDAGSNRKGIFSIAFASSNVL